MDDQGQTEGQQQPVQMIEFVQAFEHRLFNQHARGTDQQGRDDQGDPVIDAEFVQRQIRHKGAQHVLGAMAEVNDVQQAENHRQAQ